MRERLTPGTELLTALSAHRMSADIALSEFIDNAFGPAAGDAKSCSIEFQPDCIIITDNGRGIEDMNAMFTLAKSKSRSSKADIGRYGVGAKYAMLHFGDRVDVETVRKRRYHQRSVSWAYVRRSGKWPLAYRSAGKPTRKAPEPIRHGGTIITVSALHRGRRRIQMDWLCKRLTHTSCKWLGFS